ncbi:Uncharacterized protein Adt_03428 [Abeliophyllum distichum]|uniref:Reverse transcriptase domain-containing protein n=1 Tax=Abeliophyllum distichum TaxID=126358 RepID=A0ABD1W1T2_9LAMI
MAETSSNWPADRGVAKRVAGMHEVDVISALSVQMAAMEKKMMDTIARNHTVHAIQMLTLEYAPPAKATPQVKAYVPPIPFSQRLEKHKLDKQFKKFLEVFKKLHINIPFAEALAQMPSYAKFMKDILSNKRKLEEHETMVLTEKCSAILQNKLPPKLKDLGNFTIVCTIGDINFNKALCGLGASINLMPSSVYRRLGLGEAKETTVSLQLADRSIKYPR